MSQSLMPEDGPTTRDVERLRSLWFESRHLETGAPGLHGQLAALAEPEREELLAIGDRLAGSSLTLAQQYCRQAPVARSLGREHFLRWVERGESLTRDESGSRDAALSYFTLAPEGLAQIPDDDVDLWLGLAQRVLGTSRRLGELLVAESGPILGDLDRRPERLTRWVEVGLDLVARGGWEAELLGVHYFEATALALPLFAPSDYGQWAELARATERLNLPRSEFFASAPAALHRIPERDRSAVLALALEASAAAPAVALEIYFSVPGALEPFPAERDDILASLTPVAVATPSALTDLLPVLRALLAETPGPARGPLVALARTLAAEFPDGVVPFYRVLPRLLERTSVDGIERWAREGLAIAADHRGAGRAYFGLDSRTSRTVLAAGSTAVAFSEVQGLLKRYLQMLTGGSWQVTGRLDAGYRPPFARSRPAETSTALPSERTPTASNAVSSGRTPAAPPVDTSQAASPEAPEALFPLRVAVFPAAEDNLRLYRLIAAQHAARIAFGTNDLAPPLPVFLERFDQPAIAEHLLGIFEGVRLDAALARAYRGLAADVRAVAEELARSKLRLSGTIAHLASILEQARRGDVVSRLAAMAERLASPEATVAESAQATVLVYTAIMRSEEGLGLTLGPSGFPELFADRSPEDTLLALEGGATMLGADEGAEWEEEPQGSASPTADDDASRARIQLEPEIDAAATGPPIDPVELLRLLQDRPDLSVKQASGDDVDTLGLYVSDLAGKLPRERIAELQGLLRQVDASRAAHAATSTGEGTFFYDEWDHRIGDYRSAWCRLAEITLESDTGDFFHRTLTAHAELLPEIRRQFQRIKPERYRVVHALEDGEDFDLDAVITARADRRSGYPPSTKLYQARQREERDVATLFLLDMSASTDEPVPGAPAGRRVIDITKEALVVMSEALEEIGDTYGIYGFSGHGRRGVEFYVVKQFAEQLSGAVKGKVGAIEPRRSTRMGTALRHATAKMRTVTARSKHIMLLSDGFPQDLDYGDDRRSNVYGIQDTMMAFQEAIRAGVTPFCITVDKAGHDYLKEICEASRYLVIEDITALPRELPKIYQRFVRP